MLDPWIIEEIIKREREDRQDELPALEIPLDRPDRPKKDNSSAHEDDEVERGVVIVDFRV